MVAGVLGLFQVAALVLVMVPFRQAVTPAGILRALGAVVLLVLVERGVASAAPFLTQRGLLVGLGLASL